MGSEIIVIGGEMKQVDIQDHEILVRRQFISTFEIFSLGLSKYNGQNRYF